MNRILFLILIGATSCSEPFEFGNEDWVLRWTSSDGQYQDHYFRVEGDTMKMIWPGTFDYSLHSMNLTSDSLTLPNPCDVNRVAYHVNGDELRIDSNYSIIPLKSLTSVDLFENSSLRIELENADDQCDEYEIDVDIYVGKRIEESDYEFNSYFGDDYILRITDMYADSSDVLEWADATRSYINSPVRIALYIDKGFGVVRTNGLVEYLSKAFNGQVEFYEGRFAPNSEFYVKMKKRNANTTYKTKPRKATHKAKLRFIALVR